MKVPVIMLVMLMAASVVLADQLVMGSVTKEGTLQGFDKGKFKFLTNKGKFVKEQASRVTSIVLPKPRKATYELNNKKTETAILKGFNKQNLTFVKDGKDTVVPLKKIKKLDIQMESEGGGTTGSGEGGYPIPAVDPAAFEGDLTPQQQEVLDKFKEAKNVFDAFVKESAALVAQMDAARGDTREGLLNQLRKRKNEEQPLKRTLIAAYDALENAFPE